MNPEFANRQAQVLEILEILAKNAKKNQELLVFIGGSAVQSMLKKPKRLSIDLDMYWNGNAQTLSTILQEHQIEKRPTRETDLFSFYRATRGNVLVKIDIARFSLLKKGKSHKTKKLITSKKAFVANVATPEYLLASKLSSLAINTIGRKKDRDDFQMNFLKDVFDSNCLLDEFQATPKTWNCFVQVCSIQNQLQKTNFSMKKVIESAINALLDSTQEKKPKPITQGVLRSFEQYLLTGSLQKPEYWQMAYRLAALLQAFKQVGPKETQKFFLKIEETANKEKENQKLITQFEKKLVQEGFNAEHLHELKILAPKAIIYLFESSITKKR